MFTMSMKHLFCLFVLTLRNRGVFGHVGRELYNKLQPWQRAGPGMSDGVLSFLVLADWGGQTRPPFTTTDELACAKQMGIIAQGIDSSFVLALGDNFYEYGIQTDAHDTRFKTTFENVFTAQSLQTPWYVVAGNHDWIGNITAEMEYTKISTRWTFPSLYYSFNQTIPVTKTTIAYIMIDTVVLCGIFDDYTTGDDEVVEPADKSAAEKQWKWIERQLQNTKDLDYVIVAGHYPVWSIAEHGPTSCLVSRLRPMLIKYKVNAYFCGHDHNLQHLREQNSAVEYFVVGAGHDVSTSEKHKDEVPPQSLKFHSADPASLGGFAYVEATQKSMKFIFADGKGEKDLYMAEIKPRSK